MPLPSAPNSISMSQVAAEFEDTAPHSFSEFYGLGTPPLPSSGAISMDDFRGTSSYEENTWTIVTSGSVGHTRVQNASDFETATLNTSAWQAGDLIVWVNKTMALDGLSTNNPTPAGYFARPSSWTEGRITENLYGNPNLSIFAGIITSSQASNTNYKINFSFNTFGISTVDHSWGYGYWVLRKTSGTPGHDSVERQASRQSTTTNSNSISATIPPFTPFDNADAPILVGMTAHNISTSGWSQLTNYSGMNSNTLGHANSLDKTQNWAAAIQTWSNRSQPSNITGYATGHTVAWTMFVTPPT